MANRSGSYDGNEKQRLWSGLILVTGENVKKMISSMNKDQRASVTVMKQSLSSYRHRVDIAQKSEIG